MKKPITYFGPTGDAAIVDANFSHEETVEFNRALAAGDFVAISKLYESKIKRLTPEESAIEFDKTFGRVFDKAKKIKAKKLTE